MVVNDVHQELSHLKHIHFRGSTAASNGGKACVTKNGNTAVKIHFINCKFSNNEHGINQAVNLTSTAATGDAGLVVEYCDMSGVDQAIVSNCNTEISFSQLECIAQMFTTQLVTAL